MVLILVDQVTERLKYTLDFVFAERGITYSLTTGEQGFISSEEIKLNYSKNNSTGICPSELLFEEGIRNYTIDNKMFEGQECLSLNSIIDPLAAIFYVLSRYEEYGDQPKDEHGRFPFASSCLNSYKLISKAVCDRWANGILKFLEIEITERNRNVNIIPTFDIDNTYAYKLKTGSRKWLAVGKDMSKLNIERLKERKKSLKDGGDPYDTFDTIIDIASKFQSTQMFWLVGDLAEKDRNISTDIQEHAKLIQAMDKVVNVNLHPSYASFGKSEVMKIEKLRLEKIINHEIVNSRQHFLRFELPESFRILENEGFTHEYSMGFAEHVGFRSGTARPHRWFDVEQNRVSQLIVHPFVYMDGTLLEYMNLNIQKSEEKIQELYNEISEYGGDFIFIWHNETIGDYGKWKGWSQVLDFTLKLKE
ncbi:MAG: polysaccharide deacetylase family protein [Crocinitomicaceae bacterium]|nr:polysaccharide deacetylase family protein [Crocinitomicaceae bacterium]